MAASASVLGVRGGLASTSGSFSSYGEARSHPGQSSATPTLLRGDSADRTVLVELCTTSACCSSIGQSADSTRRQNTEKNLAWGHVSSTALSVGHSKASESARFKRKDKQGSRLDSGAFLGGSCTHGRGFASASRSTSGLQMVIEAPPFLNDDLAGPLPWHAAELQGRIETLSNESRFDALHGGAALGTRSGQGLQTEEGLREGAGGADTWSEGEGIAAKPSLWQDDVDALSAVAKVAELAKLAVKSAEDAYIVEAEREALEAESEFIAAHQYEDLLTPEDYALLQKARAQDVEEYNAEMKSGSGPDPSPFRVAFEQALQMPLKKKKAIEKGVVANPRTKSKRAVAETKIEGREAEELFSRKSSNMVSTARESKKGLSRKTLKVVSARTKFMEAPARRKPAEAAGKRKTVGIPVGERTVEVPRTELAVASFRRGSRLGKSQRLKKWAQQQAASSGRQRGGGDKVTAGEPSVMESLTRGSTVLKPEEEIECTELIREKLRMEQVMQHLAAELGRTPTEDEVAESFGMTTSEYRDKAAQGETAKERMVKSNLRLVVSVAKAYQGRGLDLPDLVQEGNVGLIRGIEKFDTSLGYKFSTYAHWWIRQAVTRAVAEYGRTIRLPTHIYEAVPRVSQAKRLLRAKHNREPTIPEIAALTEFTEERVAIVLAANIKPRSAEQKISFGDQQREDEETLLSQLSDSGGKESGIEQLAEEHLHRNLATALGTLDGREREIIQMRYGLDDGRSKSFEEIGCTFKVSKERIRQIVVRALKKLQDPTIVSELKDYVEKH